MTGLVERARIAAAAGEWDEAYALLAEADAAVRLISHCSPRSRTRRVTSTSRSIPGNALMQRLLAAVTSSQRRAQPYGSRCTCCSTRR